MLYYIEDRDGQDPVVSRVIISGADVREQRLRRY